MQETWMTFFLRVVRSIPGLSLLAIMVIVTHVASSRAAIANSPQKPVKTVAVIHCDYQPVSFIDKKTGRPAGFFVDIMESVAGPAGMQVTYICKRGWAEMIDTIEDGEADVGVLLKSKEREKRLLFSAPIDVTYLSFFARSKSEVKTDRLPEGYTLGVIRGSMSYEHLKNLSPESLRLYGSYQEGIFGLLAGEIGLFAGEESMVLKHARESGLEDRIKKAGQPFVERERGFAVRKDNVQLIGLLNEALRGFVGSPQYRRIYLKWYGRPAPFWTKERILTASGIFIFVTIFGMALWRYASISRINKELVRSINDREQAQEALRESEGRYKAIVENQAEFVVRYIAGGIVTFINDTFCKYLAMTREQVLGKSYYPYMHEGDRESFVRHIESLGADNPSIVAEARVVLMDGRTAWHKWTHNAICDTHGRITEYQATGTDITEKRQSEEALRKSEEMLRSVLDSVDEGFVVIDRNYCILAVNRAYCEQVGLSDAEIIGKHCYTASHALHRPCYEVGEDCAVKKVFETGEPCLVSHHHSNAAGNVLYVETKAFPQKDASGTVTSVIESISNVTEKYLLEAERLKTQKLEAIGTLAGGIAHDFNNLLQGVFGYISMVRMHLDQKEKALDMLSQAEKALHMSVNLTSQLLTFSKGGMPAKKNVALSPLIESSVKFALSGSRINYTLTCDKALRRVEADEGQIGRVIQNIVLNAEQAMPMGGTISVRAKNMPSSAKGLPLSLPEGDYVEISVTDGGIGIPQQWLSRIFDPYFTTKDKGSGLGLATSYSIIKNHGGLIDVKSKPGEGTTFIVYLPALEADEEIAGTVPAAVAASRKGRILIMDDEEIIRNITGIMITTLGHEVEFAENGEEALAKYREALKSCRRFDAVILDLTIRGGKGGEETIKELLALDPEAKAIVSSGYANSSAISESKLLGFRACLTKPYDVNALKDVLAVLLP
jgi:two-component system cell cycle sensor histidine kinase/response regulator CckA